MTLSDSEAIMLLTCKLGKRDSDLVLSVNQYNRLVTWLIRNRKTPKDLVVPHIASKSNIELGFPSGAVEGLLRRGPLLKKFQSELSQQGLTVVTRADVGYPSRMKRVLGFEAPPVLFASGNKKLLESNGLAVVGSRNIDVEATQFTWKVGHSCAMAGITIVSGGARGVDTESVDAALHAGGHAVVIIPHQLRRRIQSPLYKEAIANRKLLVLSAEGPEEPFTARAAMKRNKFIYAMADFALVVRSDYHKGGTWAGATEQLQRDKGPQVFVRITRSSPKGNLELQNWGAKPWPEQLDYSRLKFELGKVVTNNLQRTL